MNSFWFPKTPRKLVKVQHFASEMDAPCRFIYAIAAVGATVLLTSVTGLCGASGKGRTGKCFLHLYSFLLVTLLLLQVRALLPARTAARELPEMHHWKAKVNFPLSQLSVAVALFADPKINSHLPPDPTGNQACHLVLCYFVVSD